MKNMNKFLALAMIAVSAVACQKSGQDESKNTPDNLASQMSVVTSLKGTKAMIDGVVMPAGSTIGVQVLKSANAEGEVYPSGDPAVTATDYADANNIKFDFDGAMWSCSKLNTTTSVYDASKFVLAEYLATSPVDPQVDWKGKAMAYAPYNEGTLLLGALATIPVTTIPSGEIDVKDATKGAFANADEVDYLFSGMEATEANFVHKANTVANFAMKHAMVRVSFVITKNATNIPNPVYFQGFTIQSEAIQGADLTTTMNVENGVLTNTVNAQFDRMVKGYTIGEAPVKDGADSDIQHMAKCGPWVGVAAAPTTAIDFAAKPLKAKIKIGTVKNGTDGGAYNVEFTAANGAPAAWVAGKHYVYHVILTDMNSLQVSSVSVLNWVDTFAGSAEIK